MSIVTITPRIASAYTVFCGRYGDVTRHAQQRGVCRQWVYRQAAGVQAALEGTAHATERDALRQRIRELEQRQAQLEQQLTQAVVLDADRQAAFAGVGQARGVSLPDLQALLEVLLPQRAPSVAKLGRWTQAAGQKAGALLAVLDPLARPHVRQAVLDEIYVRQPVCMVVEPDSLCWVSGSKGVQVTGADWAAELDRLPQLEQ